MGLLLAGRLHDLGKDALLLAGKDIPMRVIPLSHLHAAAFTLLGFQNVLASSGMVIERLAVRIRMISARRSFIVTVDHLLSLGSGCMVTAKPEAYFPV